MDNPATHKFNASGDLHFIFVSLAAWENQDFILNLPPNIGSATIEPQCQLYKILGYPNSVGYALKSQSSSASALL